LLPLALNLLLRQSAALAAYARSLHVSGAVLVAAAALVPFAQLGGLLGSLHRSVREHTTAHAGATTLSQPGLRGAVGAERAPDQEVLAHRAAANASLTAPVEAGTALPVGPAPKPARPCVRQGLERGPPALP